MAIKCVIFDLGDTIWNTTAAKGKSANISFNQRWLESKGFKASKSKIMEARAKTEHEWRVPGSMYTRSTYGRFSSVLLRNLGIKATKRMAIEAEDAYHSNLNRKLKLMPNARIILSWLNKNKFVVLALSNAHTRPQLRRVKEKGIKHHFDKVFISDALGYEKSSVTPFKIVLKWLKPKKIGAGECLMVGNDYVEDASAKKAGIKTVILTVNAHKKDRAAAKPDYEIKNLIELKKIISELN